MKYSHLILFAVVSFLGMNSAQAALGLALGPDTQSAAAGTEVVFAGTLTNTSAIAKLYLNNVAVTLSGASATALTLKSNAFFANVPGVLLPGETYTGPLFGIALSPGATAAEYPGSITFQGGAHIFAATDLASAGFIVTVPNTSAPHSADTNGDFKISPLELSRVIELFNTRNGATRTGCYIVDAAGEDGFAPDPSRAASTVVTLTKYHSGDSNHDGKISPLELSRVIDLYNYRSANTRTGQYHAQAGTEDNFAPGP